MQNKDSLKSFKVGVDSESIVILIERILSAAELSCAMLHLHRGLASAKGRSPADKLFFGGYAGMPGFEKEAIGTTAHFKALPIWRQVSGCESNQVFVQNPSLAKHNQ